MLSDQFQRRTTIFVIWLVLLGTAIFFIPALQSWMGLVRNAEGVLVAKEVVVNVDGQQVQQAAAWGRATISFLDTTFRVLRLLLWMGIVISVVRYLSYLIFGAALRKAGEQEISSLLRTVLTVGIYIVAFFIIFQTQFPKVELAPLFTGSAIIGIVVGLALQDTLGNLFAGIAIQADQSFQVGDVVQVGEQGMGTIESVSWRGVKIRTFQNKMLVISNSVIGKETLEIAPKENLNARIVRFNTIYTTSPARVIQIVREAVRQIDNVSPKRRPKVRIWNLGDNGIDWEIKYWTTNYRRHNDTDALIRQRVWYAFQREGIDFAYPTRTIYTAKQSEEEAVFVDTADEICERINSVSVFAPLSSEETKRISSACFVRVFAPEEPIIEAGQTDSSMFIVHKGRVSVQVKENGVSKAITTLKPGDFFGEMSLLTGQPRTADVIADAETTVIEISSIILKPLFESNPELARVIGEIITERREMLDAQRTQEQEMTESDTSGPVFKIKKFFGIE
ncbi:MAG: mechanosensitive ion channel [Pyrinomonadaceae bacterium]|nr:mechanosensitive ion channel [Pyrinomonadaceae bacterium]